MVHNRSRSRSRSPYRVHSSHQTRRHRTRSRSPHNNRQHRKPTSEYSAEETLPFHARRLSKHDYNANRNLFALYLDIQKQLILEDLSEREAKGRWKSFLGKWNRGELPEGWYDPATREKANKSYDVPASNPDGDMGNPANENTESGDDEIGPALPSHSRMPGPGIPSREDLELRDELIAEESASMLDDLRYSRKLDRKAQKEHLEELVPRADPNSRERRMEKRADAASTQRSYVESKSGGDIEVADSELMGEDGLEGYKRRKAEMQRKKNEREIRKEEILRARAAEREERLAKHKEKEEKTMDMLRALARERFGGGG